MAAKEVLELIERTIGPLEQRAHQMLDTRTQLNKRLRDTQHRIRTLSRATGH